MNTTSSFHRSVQESLALFVAFVVLVAGVAAQTKTDTPPLAPAPTKSASPEELTQPELLKSYLQIREQLYATQQAIATGRLEAEANARAQAAVIAAKLEAMKGAMEEERARQKQELEQANRERERQQMETQRSIRTAIWIAVGFGGIGLLSMLLTPLLQWVVVNRMAKTSAQAQLQTVPRPDLLPAGTTATADRTVTLSNQRLNSVIARMEQRILELEQTAVAPLPMPAAESTRSMDPFAGETGALSKEGRVAMWLERGKSLLDAHRASESLACYDEVLKIDPDHADALVKKGVVLERLKRNEDAIRCYERAIKLNPKMTLAYLYKGNVCNRLERFDEALVCYEEAMRVEETERKAAAV